MEAVGPLMGPVMGEFRGKMDGKKIIFYQDFPKYGLEKETCCNCEDV